MVHALLGSALTAALATSAPAVEVSGGVATTTWTSANSPYRVTDTVRVTFGDTLTIEPGVDVLFDADVPFIVEGALHARGTASDSVRFLPGAVEGWTGVRIYGPDSSSFRYTRVSGVATLWRGLGSGMVDGARVSFRRSVFSRNRIGGVGVVGSSASFDSCRIIRNDMGGMYVGDSSRVTITDCDISDNDLAWAGGGILIDGGSIVSVSGTQIVRNGAWMGGGGIYMSAARIHAVRCLITDNVLHPCDLDELDPCNPPRGGGLWADGSIGVDRCSVTLDRCTIAGNTVVVGGALHVNNATADVSNSVIWGAGKTVHLGGVLLEATYSDVADSVWPGVGNISLDPLFADAAAGDYRLLPGSPCIDAGDPALLDPDGTRSDIGAIPFDPTVGVAEAAPAHARIALTNYPNPFNPSTTLRYDLPRAAHVRLSVYDVTGRHVRTVFDRRMSAGSHQTVWDGTDVAGRDAASGVYVVRLTTNGELQSNSFTNASAASVRRVLLLR